MLYAQPYNMSHWNASAALQCTTQLQVTTLARMLFPSYLNHLQWSWCLLLLCCQPCVCMCVCGLIRLCHCGVLHASGSPECLFPAFEQQPLLAIAALSSMLAAYTNHYSSTAPSSKLQWVSHLTAVLPVAAQDQLVTALSAHGTVAMAGPAAAAEAGQQARLAVRLPEDLSGLLTSILDMAAAACTTGESPACLRDAGFAWCGRS